MTSCRMKSRKNYKNLLGQVSALVQTRAADGGAYCQRGIYKEVSPIRGQDCPCGRIIQFCKSNRGLPVHDLLKNRTGGHVIMGIYKPGKRRFWEKHIEKWKVRGVSRVEYCRLDNVSIMTFRYRKGRAGRPGWAPPLVELPPLKYAPVRPSPACAQLCLIADQDYRIEIAKGFRPEGL